MTEKNNFVYELFLWLHIPDFSLSCMLKLNPPKKGTPLFPLKKLRSCQAPLFENLVGGSNPLTEKGGILRSEQL